MIRHIWFDVEGTLTPRKPDFDAAYDAFRYRVYAEVTGRPVSDGLKREFDRLYERHATTSAVFTSLGKPSGFWQEHYETLDLSGLYDRDERVPATLEWLRRTVPISCFTNLSQRGIDSSLAFIGARREWFTYVLSGDDVPERKPAVAGFHEMVRRSELPPEEMMYVGDRVNVDILPAKAVGMQTCLVWGASKEATHHFDSIEGLLTLFTVSAAQASGR
ncbi:HAD family hydrolase [Candidatus Woesearchaeota archaeon]|nr:HAD family hydrolase [Candidatus Woesearchaeota archaeon]